MALRFILFATSFGIFSAAALAANGARPATSAQAGANCAIHVKSVLKTGMAKEKVYDLKSKNKAACEQAGKLFEINYAPKMIQKIEVKTQWLGG